MKAFLMAHDIEGLIIICKGLNIPTNEEWWNENNLKLIQANSKAMNMLYNAMNEEDFKNISTCYMAKEIWEKHEHMYGDKRKEEQIEENQCSTNDKAKYEESSRSQSSNENEFLVKKKLFWKGKMIYWKLILKIDKRKIQF